MTRPDRSTRHAWRRLAAVILVAALAVPALATGAAAALPAAPSAGRDRRGGRPLVGAPRARPPALRRGVQAAVRRGPGLRQQPLPPHQHRDRPRPRLARHRRAAARPRHRRQPVAGDGAGRHAARRVLRRPARATAGARNGAGRRQPARRHARRPARRDLAGRPGRHGLGQGPRGDLPRRPRPAPHRGLVRRRHRPLCDLARVRRHRPGTNLRPGGARGVQRGVGRHGARRPSRDRVEPFARSGRHPRRALGGPRRAPCRLPDSGPRAPLPPRPGREPQGLLLRRLHQPSGRPAHRGPGDRLR